MTLAKRQAVENGINSNPKRKKHKNSKLGCKECKSRRIKCDTNLQLLNTNKYCCLNCLMKWKRANENNPNQPFNDICSFSFLSPQEILALKKDISAKEFIDYHEMNQQRIYPVNNIQIILSKEDIEQQLNLDLNEINIKRGFEITMIPHNQIEVPASIKMKRGTETVNQINSRVALAQLCMSGLNFVDKTTVSYYTSLAVNSFIAKLKKYYVSELKGMDAIFDQQSSFTSNFLFDSSREDYEKHLNILNSVPTFDEKKSLIIKYIKLSQNFLQEKLSMSYKNIRSSLDVIINKRRLISYNILINCHIGSYILKTFELYSLVTDDCAMNRFIEHTCSAYEICWELNSIFQENIQSGNNSSFIDSSSITKSTYDYDFKNTINCLGGDSISFFALAMTGFNQNFLHMKSIPIKFLDEVLKMLLDFGDTFILTNSNDDTIIDPLLKEDFKNLALFIEQFLKSSVFMDSTKALPLQPNLLWQLTYKFFQIKPKKIFSSSLNKDENAKKLLGLLTIDKKDSYYKYSSKNIIDEYTKNGFLTPIEKVLYSFYIAVDIAFVNILPSRMYVFDAEAYGVCGWNVFTFENIIYDLDLNFDVDKNVVPFANYIFRISSYMNRRKVLFSGYTCLNNFYSDDSEEKQTKHDLNNFETSEKYLPIPCYASRIAHNVKEVPISNFLTTTIKKENYFSLDNNYPIPLELLISFKNNHQQKTSIPFKSRFINKKGHYWDGHFYLIKYEEYTKYQHNLCDLNEKYQRHLNFYFKNLLLFKKLFQSYNDITGTVFPDFNLYDINILAIENLDSVYKFEEKIINDNFIKSLNIRLSKFKTLISNIYTYQKMHGTENIYMDFADEKLRVTDYHLLLNIFLSLDKDQRGSRLDTISIPSLNAVTSVSTNTVKSHISEKTETESQMSSTTDIMNDPDGIKKSHHNSMLVSNCGLFEEDYDPFLGCTVAEGIYRNKANGDLKEGKNEENNIPEFHFFMPDFNYIKMIRKDKNTLLFYDGRDEEDK